MHKIRRKLASIASTCAVSAVSAGAMAANIQVTTTSGGVNTSDGLCSLPEAVTTANSQSNYGGCVRQGTSSIDSIFLGSGVYSTSQSLTATRGMMIRGTGSTTISFSGSGGLTGATPNSSAVFYMYRLRITSSQQSNCVAAQSGATVLIEVDVDACNFGLVVQSGAYAYAYSSKLRNGYAGVASFGNLELNSTEVSNNTNMGLLLYGSSSATEISGGDIAYNHTGVFLNGAQATISGANVENNQDGGGIRAENNAQVEISDSTIASNTSTSGGGGIYSLDSNVAINGSLIDSNVCSGSSCDGGGILCIGKGSSPGSEGVTLTDSNVTYNVSFSKGGGVAVKNQSSPGTNLALLRSTLAHNSASGHGGGLYSSGQEAVIASTISSNYSGGKGGGMYHEGFGELHVFESTIANNHGSEGGGLFALSASNPVLSSSIFANNTAYSGNHDLSVPSIGVSWGGNLLVTDTRPGYQLNPANFGTLYHGDPKLGPLTMIGGHLVHKLGAGSGASNKGNSTSDAPDSRDQLGVLRPVNGLLDLGAVEY